eukprot:CAMPEP_0119470980 /NCGR_PEP_ID=MMETSP1344-20130328/3640_1 /TAXON_ID=236787 /ORGANISM="Florenciella parvula, Strain CCMP2471" /LENGTH=227 /DNA_ID=CAMNT_0007503715 /DNA_START=136 /DNA_END=819 /DNA_ORIENTATION=-
MRVLVALALISGASAFAPSAMPRRSAALKPLRMSDAAATTEAAPAEEEAPPPPPPPPKMSQALPFMECPAALDGTMAGDVGFDPLGFTNWIDVRWLREAEIKHGRICQLAIVGFAGTDLGFRLPGEMHQVSSILAHDVALKYGAMNQLFLWLGLFEIFSMAAIFQMLNEDSGRTPGDFKLDPLGFCKTPELEADYKLKEITHCRLAMFAFSGMVTQAVLTQGPYPYL